MLVIKPIIIRPRVHLRTKSTDLDDFPVPPEVPYVNSLKKVNPIKKFLMDVFKIEEIDHEKFREEDKWAIRIKKSTPINRIRNIPKR